MKGVSIPARAWTASRPPRHILAIRLQAMGDVVITLPYLNDLKRRYPETAIDLLTREETGAIPKDLEFFQRVRTIGGGRNFKRQWFASARLLPQLLRFRYDVVLDLQNNEISRLVTKCLRPHAWSRFDKTSPRPAGERTRHTIEAAGLGPVRLNTALPTRGAGAALRLLQEAGWREGHRLVALNPAGAFATRNWPLQSWVGFARAWQSLDSTPTQFLLLGLDTMKAKAPSSRARSPGELSIWWDEPRRTKPSPSCRRLTSCSRRTPALCTWPGFRECRRWLCSARAAAIGRGPSASAPSAFIPAISLVALAWKRRAVTGTCTA